ncbi:MAG: PQQ-binding-like beta-propeller repeat protein [Bryobacteraceae bacterium]|jgi:outer membrane protein assembly factor BamB
MRYCLRALFLALLALAAVTRSIAGPDDWPGWRGPSSNGVSPLKNLPSSWSHDQNVAWKTAVPGRGHASPVVWGNRIFLTTDIEGDVIPGAAPPKHKMDGQPFRHPDSVGGTHKHTLKVLCFDAASGKQLWERIAYEGAVFDDIHKFNTYASPTPVTDGKYLYAYFESQGLYKYDFDGNLLWKMSLGGIATLGVGPGDSPILFEDKILILADQDEGETSFLAAVSTADGKIAWKTPRKEVVDWTTPVIVESGKQPALIVPAMEDVVAYDPRTGKELWRTEGLQSNSVHTPVFGHGMVYVSSGFPKKIVMAIRLDPAKDQPRIAWKYDKGTGYIPSPILYGDYLYVMTGAGLLSCLDAVTGEVKYEGKRFPQPGQFTGAPVAFDGKLMITSNDGDTYVVKAGPDFEVLATNSLGEPVFASLALAGDSVYIRSAGSLFRIRQAQLNR